MDTVPPSRVAYPVQAPRRQSLRALVSPTCLNGPITRRAFPTNHARWHAPVHASTAPQTLFCVQAKGCEERAGSRNARADGETERRVIRAGPGTQATPDVVREAPLLNEFQHGAPSRPSRSTYTPRAESPPALGPGAASREGVRRQTQAST